MHNGTASPHRLPTVDGRLQARAVFEHPRSSAVARIGLVETPLDVVTVASGRIVASTGRNWRWPDDEPCAEGEMFLHAGRAVALQVRVVGWWSPLAASMLWLDPVDVLITGGARRVHLGDAAAIRRFLR